MATTIRILFHDTNASTSLLKHLGIKGTIRIPTTAISVEPESVCEIDFGELMGGMIFSQELEYTLIQKEAPTIAAPDWWVQPVFVRNGSLISRRQIVLAAAHKDGGAHVDELDDDLRAVKEGFWIRTQTRPDGAIVSEPVENNHFRIIRRFSDEILSSKELLSV